MIDTIGILKKEHQIEMLWQNYQNYESWRKSRCIIDTFSNAAREILAYEEYVERERQAEARLAVAEIIWRIQDSVKSANAFIVSLIK